MKLDITTLFDSALIMFIPVLAGKAFQLFDHLGLLFKKAVGIRAEHCPAVHARYLNARA